jgi:phosphoribosyl-ATP pyrophosphohydrolase/phosphoribosyl-AMP cyclohydrolase
VIKNNELKMTVDYSKYSDGLVPAVVQHYQDGRVLMVGFMNEAALIETQNSGHVTFYSRSKQRLWTKGESSGNFLELKDVLVDCDNDTLLIKANPIGPTCHTGADTCFGEESPEFEKLESPEVGKSGSREVGKLGSWEDSAADFLFHLEQVIADRKANPSEVSYTSKLFGLGINKVAQKVGEEAVELVIEAKDDNQDLFLGEAADLMFHYLILLQAKGFSLKEVVEVLKGRHK